jgi:hypothetical protein
MNLVVTTTILVLNGFASTHLVVKFVATKIYLFHVSYHGGFIGPIKFKPHFIKCYFGNVATNLAKLFVFSPLIF